MWGVIGSNGHMRGFAPFALALVLLFRLLIPSGYMVAPDDRGRPGFVLCDAAAQAAAAEPVRHGGHDGHPADPAQSKPGERPCPFAAVAGPPLLPTPPVLKAEAPAAVLPPSLPAPAVRPRVARAAPPPPATGPPLSV